MKKKVLGIVLVSLFSMGLIGTVNTNQTNQKKNVEILQNSKAEVVNCLFGGPYECELWPDVADEWWELRQPPSHG